MFNSGALIAVTEEIAGYSAERAKRRAENIYVVLRKVFALSSAEGITTADAANRFAERRIQQIGNLSGRPRSRC